jgi:signal recognition particle subunit SEC65
MSSYKTQELIDICNKLGIETTINNDTSAPKNKSKKDLYEEIIKYF